MPLLETDRLIIRRFKLSDLNDFYEYARDPAVGPDAGWDYHRSKDESLFILHKFSKSNDIWAIELKENSKVIGSIGLHRDKKRENKSARMMGYVINAKYWGQGYATEASKRLVRYAFDVLKVDIISAYHYPHNERSKAVIIKCGFSYEGTLKCATVTYDGKVYDELCYSITKDEYLNRHAENRS
ncbi:GNAT family N-acetyltransferase [Gudongella sp. DL1XJH-153]|uniref:GNAT family N-acetyltransferase n=1 Tax=Gudongella sp. DL1XJH-153 TaxID=3409804 RepID=UPI003BB720E7